MTMEACAACPHQSDCLKAGNCLDHLNAPAIGSGQFPQRMTPAQATRFMEALRAGQTQRRICGAGKFGPAIASRTKFAKHCRLYPEWGAVAHRLAAANAKAADKLKGRHNSSRTHCRRGHEFAVHGLAYKNHASGRRYRYCKLCNKINSRQGSRLPDEIVEKVKSLVRSGNPLKSFTSGGKPGYLCRFASVKLLRQDDPEFNNLVLLGAQRRRLFQRQTGLAIPKPQIIKATNLRAPTLIGMVAGRVDVVFSAVNEAVPLRLPRHIRDDVMGKLFLDVEEGRVAFTDIKQVARKYASDLYEEEKRRISLDAPAFRDGTGGSKLDRLSEADGIWA